MAGPAPRHTALMVAAQSALERGGVGASDIHTLTTVMVAGAFGGRSIQPSRNLWLFGGGVALPVACLRR